MKKLKTKIEQLIELQNNHYKGILLDPKDIKGSLKKAYDQSKFNSNISDKTSDNSLNNTNPEG